MKKVEDYYSYDDLKLTQSFQEACQDKLFVKYLSSLKF